MPCKVCDNTGWVCEEHPGRPSDCGGSERGCTRVCVGHAHITFAEHAEIRLADEGDAGVFEQRKRKYSPQLGSNLGNPGLFRFARSARG
jgi:hypothetical protein